jgi:putative oxidoreductase
MDGYGFELLRMVLGRNGEIDRRITALAGERLSGQLLRWSLGVIFLWFGALKFVPNASPVMAMVRDTYPLFATPILFYALAIFEVVIGVMLLTGRWVRWAAVALIPHLAGTFGVLLFAPQLAFTPRFPLLSMDGEFVIKNLVLLAAVAVIWLDAAPTRQPGSDTQLGRFDRMDSSL